MTKILGWFTGINILLGVVILGGCMIYTHFSLPAFASAPYLDDPYREEDLQIRIIRDTQRQLYRREAVVAKPWYFNYVWEEDGEVHEISLTVSQRYVTDFASIPVYAGWFVSPFGKHSEASVVHDYLYSIGGLTRREVDALLYAEMRKSGVDPFRAALVYSSVRFRGNPAFGRDNEWTDNFYDVVAQDRLPEGCMPSREEATKVSQTVLGTEEWNRNVAEGEFLFRSEQRAYEQENYLYDLWYGKYSAPACKEWLADGIKRLIEEKYLVATTNADKAIRGDITVYEVAAYNYLQRFKPSDELLAADMMLERLCTTDESIETWCSTQDGSGISLESDRDPEQRSGPDLKRWLMAGKSEDGKTDIEVARQVIETEAAALVALRETISESMTQAVDILMGTEGFLIVAGVGKSGHIGRKIAATLASTGTPSFFVHPTEASHGDLGMITKGSSVLAISNSGETRELRDLLIYAKREDVPVIAITAKSRSFLASQATVTLLLPKTGEACPNQLAPTSSTTMTLALGDALAVAAMARRNFTREDFGARHPGGSLGMQLQLIGEYLALRKESPNPVITEDAIFADVLKAVSEGRYGAVSVIDASGALKGVVTDGDIRRAVMGHENVQAVTARQMMNPTPVTVAPDERIGIAIQTLENRQISQIIVEEDGKPVGLVHIKDLMSEGYLQASEESQDCRQQAPILVCTILPLTLKSAPLRRACMDDKAHVSSKGFIHEIVTGRHQQFAHFRRRDGVSSSK